jgi:hypothetical protein
MRPVRVGQHAVQDLLALREPSPSIGAMARVHEECRCGAAVQDEREAVPLRERRDAAAERVLPVQPLEHRHVRVRTLSLLSIFGSPKPHRISW